MDLQPNENQNPNEVMPSRLAEMCACLAEIRNLMEKSVKLLQDIADKPPKEK